MIVRRSPPLVLAVLLAGCTVGPNYQKPEVATPATFINAPAGAPVVDRWWEQFGDPTLTQLVNRALQQNLELEAANARIAQARASLAVTRAEGLPQVNGNASVQRQRLSENGVQLNNLPPGVQPDLEFPVYRASIDASWEIDLWGRQRRRNEAANARADAAVEGRRDTAVRIAAEVARNYADLRAAQRRLAVAQETAASSRKTLELVQRRVRAGEEAQLEANRAASELREIEAGIPTLQGDIRAASYAIDVLVGQQPGFTDRVLAQSATTPTHLEVPLVGAGLPSSLLRRRPDIRQAERNLAAETADIGVAVADLYPRFSLTGTLGLESVKAGDFLESASRFWQIGPSLLGPIFDGGRRRAEVRRQRAQVDEAYANYQQTVLRALSDVETALIRLQKDQARAAELRSSRSDLGRNLELSRLRYRVGEADLLEVLDVERRVARLDDLIAQADARVLTDTITLQKALGGGWTGAEQQTAWR